MDGVREVVPFGPIADYTERVVVALQDYEVSPEARGETLAEVLTEMATGLWTRDVLRAWAFVVANLSSAARLPSAGDSPGARVMHGSGGRQDMAWRRVGVDLIDEAHGHNEDALNHAIDSVFKLGKEGSWQLVWSLANSLVDPLEDGSRLGAAAAATAAAGETANFDSLINAVLNATKGRLAPFVPAWATIVAATCPAAAEVFPDDGSLARGLQAAIDSKPLNMRAALETWAALTERDQIGEELRPLAAAVHETLDSVGGPSQLRAALLLHAPEFTPDEGMLCRRAATIVAAAAAGNRDAVDEYIMAMLEAGGYNAFVGITGAWLDLLSLRLHYFDRSRPMLVDGRGMPIAMIAGRFDELDEADEPQRVMAKLFRGARRLRDGDAGGLEEIAKELAHMNEEGVLLFRQLALLMGQVLQAALKDFE